MKQKILAELKKQFPGLQSEFLGFLATKLEAKVTDENEIEGAISELNKILPIKEQADFFQQEADRRVTSARQKFEEEFNKKNPPKNEPPKNDPPKDDPDFTLKFKELSEKLAALEKKESQKALTDRFNKMLAEKKIPLKFGKGRVIDSEDQLEPMLAEVESDFEEVMQDMVNQGLAERKPLTPGGKAPKAASKEEIDGVLDSIM